ncbi:hypothetical protein AK830_g1188 [Neonectria ditissima]|uniref:Uncharacterized protein n=1 Tax=Neonectria ditissima TaxID=78410 RepID=A0A0P7BXA4_9HYPO|nr:hypothetical protein AK830_g1188 [Neonectria ditissima]
MTSQSSQKFYQVQELVEQYEESSDDVFRPEIEVFEENMEYPLRRHRESQEFFAANPACGLPETRGDSEDCKALFGPLQENLGTLIGGVQSPRQQLEAHANSFFDDLFETLGVDMLERSLQKLKTKVNPEYDLEKSSTPRQNIETESEYVSGISELTSPVNSVPGRTGYGLQMPPGSLELNFAQHASFNGPGHPLQLTASTAFDAHQHVFENPVPHTTMSQPAPVLPGIEFLTAIPMNNDTSSFHPSSQLGSDEYRLPPITTLGPQDARARIPTYPWHG